jgi:hypothetical protein
MDIQNFLSKKVLSITTLFLITLNYATAQKTVHYDLYVKDTIVNFTGKGKTSHSRKRTNTNANANFYRRRHSRNSGFIMS